MPLARLAAVGAVLAFRDERGHRAAGDIYLSDSENHREIRVEKR